jgi:hypothetical protein
MASKMSNECCMFKRHSESHGVLVRLRVPALPKVLQIPGKQRVLAVVAEPFVRGPSTTGSGKNLY